MTNARLWALRCIHALDVLIDVLIIRLRRLLSESAKRADYFYWVSVEDFAALIGAGVDKVEDSGVYLLLPGRERRW